MKRFLKFLCMCLIMSMAESAHAALPTVKDTVIISAADRKAVTLAEMAENFVDYDVVFFGEFHDQDVLHEELNQKICTARFARTLSNLYSSGVPIVATLIASRDAVGNRWIISQFDEVLDKVRAGNSLSESLALVDGFEQSMSSSIAVGEETGKLDELLATISETLDFEAEVATKRLVTLLEPIMIVIMGVIVAFVVVAVILPIYQSYGTIGQSSSTY